MGTSHLQDDRAARQADRAGAGNHRDHTSLDQGGGERGKPPLHLDDENLDELDSPRAAHQDPDPGPGCEGRDAATADRAAVPAVGTVSRRTNGTGTTAEGLSRAGGLAETGQGV